MLYKPILLVNVLKCSVLLKILEWNNRLFHHSNLKTKLKENNLLCLLSQIILVKTFFVIKTIIFDDARQSEIGSKANTVGRRKASLEPLRGDDFRRHVLKIHFKGFLF